MGRFVENLIVEQRYYGTIFPRIPVPILRDLKKKILLRERDAVDNERNEHNRNKFKPGVKVEAEYHKDKKWYDAVIDHYNNKKDMFVVVFKGYSNKEEVPIGKIKLKNNTKNNIKNNKNKSSERRSGHNRKNRDRSRSRDRRRDRSRSRERRREQSRSRDRNRSRSRDRRRERSRSRERSRKRDRNDRRNDIDKELEDFIKEREKEDASAVGRHYANRPVSYKSCLSVPMQIMTTRQRSLTPPTRPSRRASPVKSPRRTERKRKKPPSKAHLRKMEQLKRIYGDASARKNN